MKSLKIITAWTTMTVMTTGLSSGRITWKNSRAGLAPSTTAASSSSFGMDATNARNNRMQKAMFQATFTKIMPRICLNSPMLCSTQIVGTRAGGTISPANTRKLTSAFQRDRRRCRT